MAADAPIGLVCKQLVEQVTDYLERALPPDDRARFEQHLLLCDACVSYLDQVRAGVALAPGLAPPPVDEATRGKLLEAFRQLKRGGAR